LEESANFIPFSSLIGGKQSILFQFFRETPVLTAASFTALATALATPLSSALGIMYSADNSACGM
jgi:hypothetical protein